LLKISNGPKFWTLNQGEKSNGLRKVGEREQQKDKERGRMKGGCNGGTAQSYRNQKQLPK